MDGLCNTLAAIDSSTITDESERLMVLESAKALIQRLQKPHEFTESLIWTNQFTLLAMKIASDMGLFRSLTQDPKSTQQLAAETGADAALIGRILRMLASVGVVIETATDTYADNSLSAALKDEIGPLSGIQHFWPIGAAQLAGLPEYLQQTGYRNPTDFKDAPFNHFMGASSYWDFLQANPEAHAHFNSLMSTLRKGQSPWTSWYPLERLLDSYDDASSVLCVDVGGGKGRDMAFLSQALPSKHAWCSIIVQDMPSVLFEARNEGLPINVMTMSHDFFETQPIRGARIYFMHSICHDWPDREAEDILSKIGEAMRPGYSKLLLYETVMPASADKVRPRMAAMDLNMMCHFASLERTEAQWKSLFVAVGMKWIDFFSRPGAHQGIIEVELIDNNGEVSATTKDATTAP